MANTLVVLGDSISAGYGLNPEQGWVNLLRQKLIQQDNKYKIFNESLSGDTSAGGLARINQALTRYHPDLVILELGANDGLRGLSPQKMADNLRQIINRCRQSGAQVLLLGMKIPPNYGRRYTEMFYNVYPTLAKTLQIPFIPFVLDDIALARELMQADGLHPNAKAQPMIAHKIWSYIKDILAL